MSEVSFELRRVLLSLQEGLQAKERREKEVSRRGTTPAVQWHVARVLAEKGLSWRVVLIREDEIDEDGTKETFLVEYGGRGEIDCYKQWGYGRKNLTSVEIVFERIREEVSNKIKEGFRYDPGCSAHLPQEVSYPAYGNGASKRVLESKYGPETLKALEDLEVLERWQRKSSTVELPERPKPPKPKITLESILATVEENMVLLRPEEKFVLGKSNGDLYDESRKVLFYVVGKIVDLTLFMNGVLYEKWIGCEFQEDVMRLLARSCRIGDDVIRFVFEKEVPYTRVVSLPGISGNIELESLSFFLGEKKRTLIEEMEEREEQAEW